MNNISQKFESSSRLYHSWLNPVIVDSGRRYHILFSVNTLIFETHFEEDCWDVGQLKFLNRVFQQSDLKQIIPLITLWKQIHGGSVSPEQTVLLFSPTVFLHLSCIWNMEYVCSANYICLLYSIYVCNTYM